MRSDFPVYKNNWLFSNVGLTDYGLDQPGKVANPARGQLNRENGHFPVPFRALQFGLSKRVRPSRPASAL